MTNYARVLDNYAVDVSTDPWNHFHESLAKDFEEVPDFVRPMFVRVNGQWIDPKAPPIEEEF